MFCLDWLKCRFLAQNLRPESNLNIYQRNFFAARIERYCNWQLSKTFVVIDNIIVLGNYSKRFKLVVIELINLNRCYQLIIDIRYRYLYDGTTLSKWMSNLKYQTAEDNMAARKQSGNSRRNMHIELIDYLKTSIFWITDFTFGAGSIAGFKYITTQTENRMTNCAPEFALTMNFTSFSFGRTHLSHQKCKWKGC